MARPSLNQPQIYQYIVYICGFLLFWEWLRPLDTISDTGDLVLFVIYAAFCFFISMLNVKWWLSIPLKTAGIVILIDGLFMTEPILSPAWFSLLYMHAQFNFDVMTSQQWEEMTPLFRSLLFLLLLWTMSYLLYYWFVIAKRIFLFVLLTFIYITVLDTFTMYEANAAIVRTFVVSLIAMGVASLSNELERKSVQYDGSNNFLSRIVPLLLIVSCLTIIGVISPKQEPKWPDPVPFITSTAQNAGIGEGGSSVVQKVGYGENDSRLGGSFVQDFTPVFQAAVSQEHYWRIETKDRYTGKGWESSTELNYQEQPSGRMSLELFHDTVATENLSAMVRFEENASLPKLVYPYGVETVSSNSDEEYLLDQNTGSITTGGNLSQGILSNYTLNYNYPSFSINQLLESTDNDPEEIREKYLQLPEDLPDRIGNLSEQVVIDTETRYEKVIAIEQYFNRNGFAYQTEEVAVPRQGDDYVDQFLFETKVGYCDNFSTSMVVMLRTLGIPTRWVKGFTSGDRLDEQPSGLPNDLEVYEISNSNAHSWVEVYFPEIGWVPFEPTSGFSSAVDFYLDEETTETEEDNETVQEQETEEELEGNYQDFEEEAAEAFGDETGGNSSDSVLSIVLVSSAVVAAVSILLYLTRYRWRTTIMIKRYKNKGGVVATQNAYHYLLKVLDHKGIKRSQGQTLREYARHVDKEFQTTDMTRLTYHFERMIYRNEEDSYEREKITELWENLIKKTLT
ncbi:DUF4129 domain-containing protein [Aquibacillus halophilus]|uniref:DUF4129 domain-containing protein n=1 Tax=Aquibacillus halophilus TaxID=930132 RepID=A0A6A8DPD1_9BACI|nr:transglutaminaseTgpA domain-containing protein [Aquibacillus halophilus]MRH44897.1 DUF4129 domain-containing protein [Aquibacillus halophilus]